MLRDVEITPDLPPPWLTLAEVKTALGISGTSQDAAITAALVPACATIEGYCGTVIAQRTISERLTLEDATRSLVLRYAPAIALTSVSFDGTLQTLADFRLAKGTGIVRHVQGVEFGAQADWVVVYTAGFVAAPEPIKAATAALIRHMLAIASRDETISREAVPDVGEVDYADAAAVMVTGANGAQVPPSVATALAPYVLSFVS